LALFLRDVLRFFCTIIPSNEQHQGVGAPRDMIAQREAKPQEQKHNPAVAVHAKDPETSSR
jgi:hypothetical protein